MRNLSSRRGVLIAKLCQKWLTERASFSYHFYKLLCGRAFSLLSRNSDDILLKKKFDIRSWKYTYSNFHFGYIRRPIKAKTSCFDYQKPKYPAELKFSVSKRGSIGVNSFIFSKMFYQNKVTNKFETKTKIVRQVTGINPYQSLN